MNGRDKQTDCRQQRNNTLLPPPFNMHKEQEVPQIAQKDFVGKISTPNWKTNFPPRNCPLPSPPPPLLSVGRWRTNHPCGPAPGPHEPRLHAPALGLHRADARAGLGGGAGLHEPAPGLHEPGPHGRG